MKTLPKSIQAIVNKKDFELDDLIEILRYLRSENGCAWDRAQTHESIEINLIEEAYELVDAIEKKDREKMVEETGDVLLQAVFHAVLGEENKTYTMKDAINGECIKLITRHTHIFGQDTATTESQALKTWDTNKYQEKNLVSATDRVSDVPNNFPALLRAEKVQKRASKFNYDYDNAQEYSNAIKSVLDDFSNEKAGELLFLTVAFLRKQGVESELALKNATEKFIRDFSKIDKALQREGKTFESITKEELSEYYNANKKC